MSIQNVMGKTTLLVPVRIYIIPNSFYYEGEGWENENECI